MEFSSFSSINELIISGNDKYVNENMIQEYIYNFISKEPLIKKEKLIFKILKFLQLLCENCFEPFQVNFSHLIIK